MKLASALLLLAALSLPSCALGRGPLGLPVTFIAEDKPTGTEVREVDMDPVKKEAALLARRTEHPNADAFSRGYVSDAGLASPAPSFSGALASR